MSKYSIGILTTVAMLLGLASPALAWKEATHAKLADYAFWTMQAVEMEAYGGAFSGVSPTLLSRPSSPPDFASFADPDDWTDDNWNAFVSEMLIALHTVDRIHTGLPSPDGNQESLCTGGFDGGGTLGELERGITFQYATTGDLDTGNCVLMEACLGSDPDAELDWPCYNRPGKIFNSMSGYTDPNQFAGSAFGFWAASVDYRWDDTRLETAIIHGWALAALEEAAVTTGASIVWPICVIAFLAGDDECAGILEWLDQDNPVRWVRGQIGGDEEDGFGLFPENEAVGIWHFLNMSDGVVPNYYNDRSGWWLDYGGWQGEADPAEAGLRIMTDVLAILLAYDTTRGIRDYEYNLPTTFAQPDWERYRDNGRGPTQWSGNFIASIEMAPADNLALSDYLKWYAAQGGYLFGAHRSTPQTAGEPRIPKACYLAGPLHILGDVAQPHHVQNSTGWGHEPFEIVGRSRWHEIMFHLEAGHASEYEFLGDALNRAFAFWLIVKNYKESTPSAAVPIRELVTAAATTTNNVINSRPFEVNLICNKDPLYSSPTPSPWPFVPCVSLYEKLGQQVGGDEDGGWPQSPYMNRLTDYRIHFEVAISGIIALLTSTMQGVPETGEPGYESCRLDYTKND